MKAGVQRPTTAQAGVLFEIRARLSAGRLAPGQVIRQESLASELGRSRHTVRECLRLLEGEGLLTHSPHRGYYVNALDVRSLQEVFSLRDLLETEALRVGIQMVSPQDLLDMRESLGLMGAKDLDPGRLPQVHREFHLIPMRAAAMPRLLRQVQMLWDELVPYRPHPSPGGTRHRDMDDYHERYLSGVERRDVESVLQQARLARARACERLLRGSAFAGSGPEPPGPDTWRMAVGGSLDGHERRTERTGAGRSRATFGGLNPGSE